MGTVLRSEISDKSRYYIPKHRYLELKHFCMQYKDWKKEYDRVNFWMRSSTESREHVNEGRNTDRTSEIAEILVRLSRRMDMIEDAAKEAGEDLSRMLVKAVTEGTSYEYISPPCCRQVWYTVYRRFFWILDKKRV